VFFFELSSGALVALIFGVVLSITLLGVLVGHRLRHLSESLRESFAVLQAALLGVVALLLAFGLSLAVDRYENRRAAVVADANAIGTTYLRAQTLAEPMRSRSLEDLVAYTDTAIRLTDSVPGGPEATDATEDGQVLQRELWGLAGRALEEAPNASAPRLYVETLNEMIDQQTVRVAGVSNRVPTAVLVLEILGAALALGLLAAPRCRPGSVLAGNRATNSFDSHARNLNPASGRRRSPRMAASRGEREKPCRSCFSREATVDRHRTRLPLVVQGESQIAAGLDDCLCAGAEPVFHTRSGHGPLGRPQARDDSDRGISPTHRGRARSARRSRASRTSWSRSGPAGRLR
jgi:hypothetical protein